MQWGQQAISFISNKPRALGLILLFNLLLHLPFFTMPPRGTHVWRQCNTLAVARNFYEEDMDILHPRVDRRGQGNGITGMQFPLYEFGLAGVYQFTGEHFWVQRLYSFTISCLGLVYFYLLLLLVFRLPVLAFAGAWGLCWSPELYYHGINALPDILALSCSIAALYYFARWYYSQTILPFALSLLLITAAGLTKLQFLAAGLPMAYVALRGMAQQKISKQWLLGLVLFGLIGVGLPLYWYKHANDMIAQSGLADFGISVDRIAGPAQFFSIAATNLISDLPEVILNFAGFTLFILGLVYFFSIPKHKARYIVAGLCWLLPLLVFYVGVLPRFRQHAYYFIVFLPLLFIIVAAGAQWLQTKKWLPLLFLLLLLQPPLACIRIIPARLANGKEAIPIELYNATTRNSLQRCIPNDALCVVGPDISGCIYFYFLHKKGFGFDSYEQLKQPKNGYNTALDDAVANGAQYLITNDSLVLNDTLFTGHFVRYINKQGAFSVVRLKP